MRTADPVRMQRIMDTATRMFAERRYHEVRMDDIAALAGVSKGALYHHFKDKDDLYFALLLQGMRQLYDEVRERIGRAKDPEEKLYGFIEEGVRFFSSNPSYLDLIQRADQSRSHQSMVLQENRVKFLQLLIGILEEMNATGRWAVSDPEFAAHALIGMTREVLRWQGDTADDLTRRTVHLFMNGLGKPG